MLTDHRPRRNGHHYERISGVWLHSSFGPQVTRHRRRALPPALLVVVFVVAVIALIYVLAAISRAVHSSGGIS